MYQKVLVKVLCSMSPTQGVDTFCLLKQDGTQYKKLQFRHRLIKCPPKPHICKTIHPIHVNLLVF